MTLNVTDECKKILDYCKTVSLDIQAITNQLKNIDGRTQTLVNIAIKRLGIEQQIGYTYILQSDLTPEEYSLKTVNHKAVIQQILDSVSCNTLILLIENDNHEIKASVRTTLPNINLNDIFVSMVERKIFILRTSEMPDYNKLLPRIQQKETASNNEGLHYGLSSNPDIKTCWKSLSEAQKANPFYRGYVWHLLTDAICCTVYKRR